MTYTTLVAGTTISAAWANASVRDQCVTPFASAAARTSAVTSPVDGMVSTRTDAKALDYYDGTSWRQWLGLAAWGNRTSNSGTTTTEVGVLRIDSISLAANRAYRIGTNPLFLVSTVTGDVVAARLRVSTSGAATTSSTVLCQLQDKSDSSQPPSDSISALYQTSSAVTLSVLLTVGRSSGSGNTSLLGNIDLWVEDMGPALSDTGVDI